MKVKSLKIASFDILVGVLLLALGIIFFLFFYRRAEYIDITVKVTDQDILYERTRPNFYYSDHFTVGDVELDTLGRAISEIISVEHFPVHQNQNIVYVTLKVKATYDTRSKQYLARGQKIVYGAPIRFSLTKVTFDGYVVDFPGKDTSSEVRTATVRVVVRARNAEEEVAEAISVGDSINTSYGESILEVEDTQVVPAEMVTTDSRGLPYLRRNPLLKDLYLTFLISAKKIGKTYYLFDDIPLIIDGQNSFVINNTLIREAYILSVEEI